MSNFLYCRTCGTRLPAESQFCPSCGTAQHIAGDAATVRSSHDQPELRTGRLPPGRILHQRYRLLETIGQGGMGAVYVAQDTQLGDRLVAVKEMSMSRLHPTEIPRAVEQFKQEAHLLGSLHHPNLPAIHDHFSEGERWYLVMSFIQGDTLHAHLQSLPGKKLPVKDVVRIGIDLCQVLDYLHSHQPQIIFRDLKPLNIMITSQGHIYLIDFGIARHFKQEQGKDTAYYYSVGYAPPEQYGQSQTGPRSDIYSLGATMHQMLSGHNPASKPFQFPNLHLLDPSIPVPLVKLIAQMLEMDESARPASVRVVRAELENIFNAPTSESIQRANNQPIPKPGLSSPIVAQPPKPIAPPVMGPAAISPALPRTDPGRSTRPSPDRLVTQPPVNMPAPAPISPVTAPHQHIQMPKPEGRKSTRRNVLIGLGTLGVVAAGGGIAWEVFAPHPSNPSRSSYTYHGHNNEVTSVAWSPDGNRIASSSYDNTVQVWDAADGRHVFTYSVHHNGVTSVAWSPDGSRIASGSDDNTVQVWNAADGTHVFTYSGHANSVYAVAWSSDGKYLASGSSDRTVQVWDAARGNHIFTYSGHMGGIYAVAWSPNGKRIASGSYDNTVQVWNGLDGGQAFTYQGHTDSVTSVAWSPNGQRIASGSADNTVQVWNAVNGGNSFTYHKHTFVVSSVAWSPNGQRIASGSNDQTVQVWNAADGSLVFTYSGHTDDISSVAWSPDGTYIASGSHDNTVQVWVPQ